ncbi:hypothetical protein MSPP1_003353 [Malassezia sp. CBS 17886]|nr:hypothetical protein MSPP1_003353 [Malassezia sp. CBS 17886]
MADKRKSPPPPPNAGAVALAKRARPSDADGALVRGPGGALVARDSRTSSLRAAVVALKDAHGAEILDVKFAPDGQTIAAAGTDQTISLWETLGENRNIGQLQGHRRAVTCVAWLPPTGERYLVSGSADTTLAVWNTATGEKVRRWRGHKGIVNSVACARSGPRALVASASDDGHVLLWDLEERRPVDAWDFRFPVTAVEFSADASQLFVGGIDNAVHVMDIASKQEHYALRGHADTIASLALSPSGTHLLSSSLDDTVRIWDVRPFAPDREPGQTGDPRLYRTLTGTTSGFENLLIRAAWSPDGERVASGSADRTCTVWECVQTSALVCRRLPTSVDKGTVIYKLPGHRGTCTAVSVHPVEPIVVSASTDRTLLLGEIEPE